MMRIVLVLGLVLMPVMAEADCVSTENSFNSLMDQIHSAASGSDTSNLQNQAMQQAKTGATQGCNFTNNNNHTNIPQIPTSNNAYIEPHENPASPGEKNIPIDPTMLKGFKQPTTSTTAKMPKTQDAAYVADTAATPYADAMFGTTSTATNQSQNTASACGTTAAAYGNYLSSLSGSSSMTYKQGCAGVNASGAVTASSDYPTTSCSANQIGSFGLVQGAYNNTKQNVAVNSLISSTPASSNAGNTVASYDSSTGARNDPSGCSLTNYSVCGQAGDVIMVQSTAGAADTSNYDNYLIYDGNGQFYYVQPGTTPAVRHGPLPSDLAQSSFSASRPTCSN